VLPSLLVHFIKSLFLKEIISLRDVDTGERAAEYFFKKQLKSMMLSLIQSIYLGRFE